jgi:hypothetical protein
MSETPEAASLEVAADQDLVRLLKNAHLRRCAAHLASRRF